MRSVVLIESHPGKTLGYNLKKYVDYYLKFNLEIICIEYDFGYSYEKYKVVFSGDKDDIKDYYFFLRINDIDVHEQK